MAVNSFFKLLFATSLLGVSSATDASAQGPNLDSLRNAFKVPLPKTVVSAAAPAPASASSAAPNLDSMRNAYRVPLPRTVEVAASAARAAPGSSAGSPSGYGANFGDGFVGGGFQFRTRYHKNMPFSESSDGSVVTGFGLRNSRDYLGAEIAITSFSTFRSGFGSHNAISFKFHRVARKNIAVAIGWENALRTDGLDGGNSIYGVATKVFKLREKQGDAFNSVTVSAGLGGGRFQSEQANRRGESGVGGFGSIGVRVFEPVSAIADWTGQDLALGLSIVPMVRIPLVFTPAIVDVTGSAGDGARFSLGVGLGFRFAKIRDLLAPNR